MLSSTGSDEEKKDIVIRAGEHFRFVSKLIVKNVHKPISCPHVFRPSHVTRLAVSRLLRGSTFKYPKVESNA